MFTPNFPTGGLYATNFTSRPTTSPGTTVTAGGSAHTLGSSFTDILTPTFDVYSIAIWLSNTFVAGSSIDLLVNLYKGAASSEQNFIMGLTAGSANLLGNNQGNGAKRYWFPVFIPANTRISAKCQGETASDTVQVWVQCWGGGRQPHWCGTGVESLGVNTGTSSGVLVTNGTGSEGSFANIGTSTYRYGYIALGIGSGNDNNVTAASAAYDIGSGGAQYPGLDTFENSGGTDEWNAMWTTAGRFCSIPAGTALQVRGQTDGSDDFYAFLYGVY